MSPDELRAILDRLALSQVRAAHLLGVNDRTVRRWIAGEDAVPELAARVLQMAAARKLDLEWLAHFASQENDR